MSTKTKIPSTTPTQSNAADRRVQRLAAVAASTGAAATTWIIANGLLGVDVSAPSFDSASPATNIGIGSVLSSTVFATLLGWALLVILERATTRSKATWTVAALGFTLISLAGPLSGTGVTTSQRLALVLLHVVVAAVYVPLMRRTSPTMHGIQP